ncbi:MAG: hypothetical protein ACLPV4_16560 [Solirubrobacteraceae bacterium]
MAITADETPTPLGRPLEIYKPAEVIGHSRHLTLLQSLASVGEVTAFYVSELERQGWLTRSHVIGHASAMLVARHGAHGATISINHTGTGTAVAIASY